MKPKSATRPLISSLAAAALLASVPAAAQTTVMFPGFVPEDPINSAARELWRLVREKCVQGDRRVVVGTASLPVTVQAFTQDQGNHLMGAVHAAFSRLPDLEMAPFSDIGAVLEVQSVGLLSSPNAGAAEAMLNKVEILIQGSGQRVGANTNFSLKAIGRLGTECFLNVGPFVVPSYLAGEIYIPAENIFGKAANDVWTKSKGVNEVVVKARTPTGIELDRHLPDHFTRMMSKAVSRASATASEVSIGNPTKLSVVGPDRASFEGNKRWDADVVVEPRRNGFHISIEVSRKDDTPIFSDGLVLADEMPALQWAALGPATAGRTGAVAAIPRLGAVPLRIEDQIDGRRLSHSYAFSVTRESYVEVDLPVDRIRGPGRVLPVDVVGPGNKPLPTIHIVNPARPNLRRYKLAPGQYTIKVASPGPARHDYILRARAVDTSTLLEPEAPGRLLSRFQDWYAGYIQDASGQRTCYAYTPAVEVGPRGWREQLPVIWLSAREDHGGEINHLLDDKRNYAEDSPLYATVDDAGSMRQINVSAPEDGNFIQPMLLNARGQPVLNREAIRGYNNGSTLELRGTTQDGRPARVVYSLQGYRSAVNALSLACNRRDLANDLVWR